MEDEKMTPTRRGFFAVVAGFFTAAWFAVWPEKRPKVYRHVFRPKFMPGEHFFLDDCENQTLCTIISVDGKSITFEAEDDSDMIWEVILK